MVTHTLEAVLKRDRVLVGAGIAGVTAVAWLYLVVAAAGMEDGMTLGAAAGMPAMRAWSAQEFTLMLVMWAVMMVGMMLPSASPMIMLFALVARKQRAQGHAMPSTAIFVAGYAIAWSAFSVGATLLQWGLEEAALVSKMMVSTTPVLGGGVLIAAGLYQFSPLKYTCLKHCRGPLQFLITHWRPGRAGSLVMGLHHGLFCVGCCWVLMALLFVGGVMNLIWIAAMAVFVLAEKLVPWGRVVPYTSGTLLIIWGVAVLAG